MLPKEKFFLWSVFEITSYNIKIQTWEFLNFSLARFFWAEMSPIPLSTKEFNLFLFLCETILTSIGELLLQRVFESTYEVERLNSFNFPPFFSEKNIFAFIIDLQERSKECNGRHLQQVEGRVLSHPLQYSWKCNPVVFTSRFWM